MSLGGVHNRLASRAALRPESWLEPCVGLLSRWMKFRQGDSVTNSSVPFLYI